MGSPMLNLVEKRGSQEKIDTPYGGSARAPEPGSMQEISVFAMKRSSVDPRHTDYGSGQQISASRARTSQKLRDRPTKKKAKMESGRDQHKQEFETIKEEGAPKS